MVNGLGPFELLSHCELKIINKSNSVFWKTSVRKIYLGKPLICLKLTLLISNSNSSKNGIFGGAAWCQRKVWDRIQDIYRGGELMYLKTYIVNWFSSFRFVLFNLLFLTFEHPTRRRMLWPDVPLLICPEIRESAECKEVRWLPEQTWLLCSAQRSPGPGWRFPRTPIRLEY